MSDESSSNLLPIEKLRQRLELIQTSDRQWEAKCPAHDDNRESLCVGQLTGDGKLGIKCQAGCETKDVLAAIGLGLSDLFPARRDSESKSRKQAVIDRTYDYLDAAGTLLFQSVRMIPKGFRQRRPKPGSEGKWLWNIKGCPIVPYKLPELLAADSTLPVFVVEGEKDVDRLVAIGLVATCNAGGAGKWKAEHAAFLIGRSVVILPDNDNPGRKHAVQVATSLQGKATNTKIVELPDLSEKGIDLGEADQSQSGKGFRNKVTAAIYNHTPVAISQQRAGVGSLEESFDRALTAGKTFIALDNVRGKVDSQKIESFLTEDTYYARAAFQPNTV